jgi:hypothetical protein
MKLRPSTDDTGALNIGDGTYDMDVKIFLGTTGEYILFDVGNSKISATVPIESTAAINTTSTMKSAGVTQSGPITLTAASYVTKPAVTLTTDTETLTAASLDTVTTLTNAGATTVTLLAPAAGNAGSKITLVAGADVPNVYSLAEKIVAPGNITADSITLNSTVSNAGLVTTFQSDGAKWVLLGVSTQDKTDYTIQDAA